MAVPTYDHKSEVIKWISDTFKKTNFSNINVEIVGNGEKGDGYVGDLSFVNLTALTCNEETKTFNLVIKYGKQDENLRKKMPIRLTYEREIFVYSTAIPAFREFEEKHNVRLVESFMPKCFNTLLFENQEVLIFQNLKTLGYELHDRFQPLDITHLRLTLENYGKWHGLSIAYRDQQPQEFDTLFGVLDCIFQKFNNLMEQTLKQSEFSMYATLESNNEFGLINRLRERFKEGLFAKFQDLLKVEEVNSVLIHGDCWNNNIMFKYDDSARTQPTASKFLDFQTSKLRPPVYDLSYHLYSTASEKELSQFKDLLEVYHSSLSNTIKSLGSDPEKLFPYSELVRQWKEYSSFGVIMAAFVLPIALSNKEDAIDISDFGEEQMAAMIESVRQKNSTQLSSRYIAMAKHFLEFDDF